MSDSISAAPAGQSRFYAILGSDYRAQLRTDLEVKRLLRFGVIFVEFALVIAAIRLLNIETNSFEQVLTLAFGGFVVNHFLPAAWRQTFFAGLSLASVLMIFGMQQGAWLLAMGGLLIVLCHLPINFRARVALVLIAAAAMAFERVGMVPVGPSIPGTIWPILGAMFMFRLIAYLYDLAYEAAPFSPVRAITYFFMMPNVCFPLFPVVDYKTLQRSIYNDDALRLYQTGVKWMLRGLVHLALYKVVYFLAVIDPSEVVNGTGAARYMVSTYLLYLKISGLFHLIIGLLRMFGFGLAETHHFYLFASSFTDFWRRINIYWKDFIQKIIFNPIYFATKRLGATGSLVVATLVAFTATWLFHSYQWFWIRGTFPIVWSDLVFWFGLGIVVMINVLIETRLGRRRSIGKSARSLRQDAILGLKIAGTFTAICILWTIWSTPQVGDLGILWQAVLNSGAGDVAVLVGIPLGIGALGVLFGGRQRESTSKAATETETPFWREAAMVSFGAAIMILIAMRPGVLTPISPQLSNLVIDVKERASLNVADVERLRRGYYEDLGDITRFNAELWEVMGDTPPGWMGKRDQHRKRPDGIRIEFVPSTTEEFKGATRTINSHGMRDREYPLVPGPNTYRIALLGSSHDAGDGVEDDEIYENLAEDRLNAELGPVTGLTYEILNFSFPAYTPIQKLETLRLKVLAFEPDLIIYAAASNELEWVFRPQQLEWLAQNDLFDQFPDVLDAMNRAGVGTEAEEFDKSNRDATVAKLMPYAEEVFAKLFTRFRDLGDGQDAQTALLLLEVPEDNSQSLPALERLKSAGEEVGVPILDLRGAFAAVSDRSTLWVAPFDTHTNVPGHQMLADLLFERMVQSDLLLTEAPVAN